MNKKTQFKTFKKIFLQMPTELPKWIEDVEAFIKQATEAKDAYDRAEAAKAAQGADGTAARKDEAAQHSIEATAELGMKGWAGAVRALEKPAAARSDRENANIETALTKVKQTQIATVEKVAVVTKQVVNAAGVNSENGVDNNEWDVITALRDIESVNEFARLINPTGCVQEEADADAGVRAEGVLPNQAEILATLTDQMFDDMPELAKKTCEALAEYYEALANHSPLEEDAVAVEEDEAVMEEDEAVMEEDEAAMEEDAAAMPEDVAILGETLQKTDTLQAVLLSVAKHSADERNQNSALQHADAEALPGKKARRPDRLGAVGRIQQQSITAYETVTEWLIAMIRACTMTNTIMSSNTWEKKLTDVAELLEVHAERLDTALAVQDRAADKKIMDWEINHPPSVDASDTESQEAMKARLQEESAQIQAEIDDGIVGALQSEEEWVELADSFQRAKALYGVAKHYIMLVKKAQALGFGNPETAFIAQGWNGEDEDVLAVLRDIGETAYTGYECRPPNRLLASKKEVDEEMGFSKAIKHITEIEEAFGDLVQAMDRVAPLIRAMYMWLPCVSMDQCSLRQIRLAEHRNHDQMEKEWRAAEKLSAHGRVGTDLTPEHQEALRKALTHVANWQKTRECDWDPEEDEESGNESDLANNAEPPVFELHADIEAVLNNLEARATPERILAITEAISDQCKETYPEKFARHLDECAGNISDVVYFLQENASTPATVQVLKTVMSDLFASLVKDQIETVLAALRTNRDDQDKMDGVMVTLNHHGNALELPVVSDTDTMITEEVLLQFYCRKHADEEEAYERFLTIMGSITEYILNGSANKKARPTD